MSCLSESGDAEPAFVPLAIAAEPSAAVNVLAPPLPEAGFLLGARVQKADQGHAKERIVALYKIEDSIRGSDPEHRRAVQQDLPLPLVDAFFTWLAAQAKRVSRKSDLGKALAYMLTRQDGFRLFLDDGHVDIDSNLVENAIRQPAMNRRMRSLSGTMKEAAIGPGLPA